MGVGNGTDTHKEEIFGFGIHSVLDCRCLNWMSGRRVILFTKSENIGRTES